VSAHKGRRPKVHEEEHDTSERWAVSYADMMTVLVGLFIVLYAMSQVDQTKFEALRGSLAAGFGNASPTVLTGAAGVLDNAGSVSNSEQAVGQVSPLAPDAGPTGLPSAEPPAELSADAKNLAAAKDEAARLLAMEQQIEANLVAVGMGNQVRYIIDARGLVIGMVANDFYFDQGSAVLKPAAVTVIDAAAPVIASIRDQISIEGHTNSVPVSGKYATNWELSTDRATQVLRHLVEANGIPADRVAAVGYGDARPLADAGSDGLAINRRVDLVVHSPLPEPVRDLLPSVIAANQG